MCCGNCSQLRGTAYEEMPGMADDGKGLSVNTGDANKRLETMGTGEFA